MVRLNSKLYSLKAIFRSDILVNEFARIYKIVVIFKMSSGTSVEEKKNFGSAKYSQNCKSVKITHQKQQNNTFLFKLRIKNNKTTNFCLVLFAKNTAKMHQIASTMSPPDPRLVMWPTTGDHSHKFAGAPEFSSYATATENRRITYIRCGSDIAVTHFQLGWEDHESESRTHTA